MSLEEEFIKEHTNDVKRALDSAAGVIKDLIDSIEGVGESWESGDLAGAVYDAVGAADAAQQWLVDSGFITEDGDLDD